MRARIGTACLALFLMPPWAQAQFKFQKTNAGFSASELVRRPHGIFGRLLDPSKFSMSHSYSLSFFSSGGQGYNEGLYLNTMTYRISDPLMARLQIGYRHQPFGGGLSDRSQSGALFVRGASLEYKASDRTRLTFDYESMPVLSRYAGTTDSW